VFADGHGEETLLLSHVSGQHRNVNEDQPAADSHSPPVLRQTKVPSSAMTIRAAQRSKRADLTRSAKTPTRCLARPTVTNQRTKILSEPDDALGGQAPPCEYMTSSSADVG
jgi:hypothetical protein